VGRHCGRDRDLFAAARETNAIWRASHLWSIGGDPVCFFRLLYLPPADQLRTPSWLSGSRSCVSQLYVQLDEFSDSFSVAPPGGNGARFAGRDRRRHVRHPAAHTRWAGASPCAITSRRSEGCGCNESSSWLDRPTTRSTFRADVAPSTPPNQAPALHNRPTATTATSFGARRPRYQPGRGALASALRHFTVATWSPAVETVVRTPLD